ncbi:hypothetical protein A2U01_0112627, partial [Trifolium medium]|nr:hypothetical protein [Trifolium medium]
EPIHVAEPQPDPIHVTEPQEGRKVKEDDGEELGEAYFQEEGDAVQEGAMGKKGEKLEGPSWKECIFGAQ